MVAKESQNFGPLLADQASTTVAQRENVSLLEMSKRENIPNQRQRENWNYNISVSTLETLLYSHKTTNIYPLLWNKALKNISFKHYLFVLLNINLTLSDVKVFITHATLF